MDAFTDAARKLIAAQENAGYPKAKEALESKYHDLLQNEFSAMRLLQNRHIHHAEVKVRESALDESRQILSTLIDNAYNVSHHENDFSIRLKTCLLKSFLRSR